MNKYYNENNIKNNKDLCNEYVIGLLWNFDFYFNKYSKTNICTWSYKYNIAPFITDLQFYINITNNRNKMLENIFKTINDDKSIYYISENNFMNNLEHYIYISPPEKIKNKIPDKYKIIYNNNKIFPDLNDITTKILTTDNYIMCEKGSFLNKSIIKGINNINYNEYINFIRNI